MPFPFYLGDSQNLTVQLYQDSCMSLDRSLPFGAAVSVFKNRDLVQERAQSNSESQTMLLEYEWCTISIRSLKKMLPFDPAVQILGNKYIENFVSKTIHNSKYF